MFPVKMSVGKTFVLAAAFWALQFSAVSAFAQGTAFTYQGRLNASGAPANGSYEFAFTLFATNVAGTAIAGPVTNAAVNVSNGLFTTTVNFGAVFNGESNWLQIAVSTNGANAFSTLSPRQQLTPVPYALVAANVSGTVPLSQLPSTVVTNDSSGVSISGTFNGNGSGLNSLNASSLVGTLAPTSFAATIVTNFPVVTGPLPTNFLFTSHGGRLLITAVGSGYPVFADTLIGMTVNLDGVPISTNQLFANDVIHLPFVANTTVQNNVSAGAHTISLTVQSGTSTDGGDHFSATVQELPY